MTPRRFTRTRLRELSYMLGASPTGDLARHALRLDAALRRIRRDVVNTIDAGYLVIIIDRALGPRRKP